MSTETNPGVELTIPQLIHALDEKLNSQESLLSLTPEEADPLERTASLALSKLRRWRNSHLPISRLPHEVFTLIPTYLSGHITLITLTSVSTHWRRTLIACPALWTQIRFGSKEGMPPPLANLFLERAKGCAMDVRVSSSISRHKDMSRYQAIAELPPGKRIRTLSILEHSWGDVLNIIGRWADALSSIQELEVDGGDPPLFSTQPTIFVWDTLKHLTLVGHAILGLEYIRASNLTTLYLWENTTPFTLTRLIDFLEAIPTLEEVSIRADPHTVDDISPPDRTLTLSHVRRITIGVDHAQQFASHLICPSLTDALLVNMFPESPAVSLFPPFSNLLGQHSVETVDRVLMRVSNQDGRKYCSLQLRTPAGIIFRIACDTAYLPEEWPPYGDELWTFSVLFHQTVSALLSLPLDKVVSLTIDTEHHPSNLKVDPTDIVTRFTEMIGKCPNLQEVVLENYLPGYLSVFSRDKMPPVQVLVIKHPKYVSWEELVGYVTEVARTRHSQGVPLKRIEIFTTEEHPTIEGLESWVQEVKYRV